jgi:hypothetical protein
MMNHDTDSQKVNETRKDNESLTYETPMITDQGSLTELTLATTGSFTDGNGFGGGS